MNEDEKENKNKWTSVMNGRSGPGSGVTVAVGLTNNGVSVEDGEDEGVLVIKEESVTATPTFPGTDDTTSQPAAEQPPDPPPKDKDKVENELVISLNNVVCNFSVRCHLNLRAIATNGSNVEYHKTMAMLIMKFRRPRCTASIWSSGKIIMTGATTEEDAKKGARRCARVLQKLGFNVRFTNYRVVNVLATCTMPFAIKIADFAVAHPRIASYEPELHPGVTYRIADKKATLKIFSTGSITITAPNVDTIQRAVEDAYALVFDYQKERREDDLLHYPMIERKRRRCELRSLKEKQNGHKTNNSSSNSKSNSRPTKKKPRLMSNDDFIDEEEEVVESGGEDELEAILDMKTPIEVDEEETEDEEAGGFDSDASHD